MPRLTTEVLYGYGIVLAFTGNPDQADTIDDNLIIDWVSPERDEDGDPLHTVRILLPGGQARKTLGLALLAQNENIEDLAAGDDTDHAAAADDDAPKDATVGRCRACGDRPLPNETQCAEVGIASSYSQAEAAAERGCPVATRMVNDFNAEGS